MMSTGSLMRGQFPAGGTKSASAEGPPSRLCRPHTRARTEIPGTSRSEDLQERLP